MVSRRVEKDGLLLGHTKRVKEANGFVEKLVPLSEVEEGKPSASKKPQGSTPFIQTSGVNEESTSLVMLSGAKERASKSPEGDLGDEISKLLEGKGREAGNESLNGDSEDASFDLDFEDDDLGDITVHESNAHTGDPDSLARGRPVEQSSFEELRFEQPNCNESITITPMNQPVLTSRGSWNWWQKTLVESFQDLDGSKESKVIVTCSKDTKAPQETP